MGIKTEVLEEGQGDKPGLHDFVTIHYKLMLLDGTLVGNSYGEDSDMGGDPFRFCMGCGSVIRGLEMAILELRVGSKARIMVTPDLAYGTKGLYPFIPANAGLICELHLLHAQAS